MRTVQVVHAPGTYAEVEGVRVFILQVNLLACGTCQYEVTWWQDKVRYSATVAEAEVKPLSSKETGELRVGFHNGAR